MKKYNLLIIWIALLFAGCSEDVWLNHNDPRIHIPKYGFSINKAWLVDAGEYTIELSAYCAGVRPDNRKNDIIVNYALNPDLITRYNNDNTKEYAGQIVELPKACYAFSSDKIVIGAGKTHGELGIKIDLQKVKELGLQPNEVKYVIPLVLHSCSAYNLQEKTEMLEALYCVTIEEPSFYFWDNRDAGNAPKIMGTKVIYGEADKEMEYRICSYGLTRGDKYTLTLQVDPDRVPGGGELLPENAYELTASVTISDQNIDTYLPVKIKNEHVLFGKVFYLPLTIASASRYGPHAVKGTLLLKVEIKNDYEWNYSSLMNVECESTQRNAGYSVTKTPISVDKDIIRIQLVTNNTIAGVTSGTASSSSAFNNKFYRLRIIPTDNKSKYKLEIIKESTSPATLELHPEIESYYDWNYEKFYLNYRFQDRNKKWVNVTEILEAQ